MSTRAPFGTWKSPIVGDLIAQKTVSLAEIIVDEVTETIYHVESRPFESGRSVLVESATGKDVVGEGWNIRTGVHEYGGAAVAIRNGVIYVTDYTKKSLFKVVPGGAPEAVTPENPNHRFGDFKIHPSASNLVVSILEDHTKPAAADVVTTLVLINTDTKSVTTLAKGADFYSSAAFSPDGQKLTWVQWYHPDMPWEGSELVVADFSAPSSAVENVKIVAGKRGDISVNQPVWASNDTIIYATDVDGYYNPWAYNTTLDKASLLLKAPSQDDYADPAWLLGASRFGVLSPKVAFVSPTKNGALELALLNTETSQLTAVATDYVSVSQVRAVGDSKVAFIGAKHSEATSLVVLKLPEKAFTLPSPVKPTSIDVLKITSTAASELPQGIFPASEALELKIPPGDSPLYVLYSPPSNPDYAGGVEGELPPAVINCHGGPTSRIAPGLSWLTSYFTSRGWAWVDVNYGGSSGFGKQYRDRLKGNWGIVDVDDSALSVKLLADKGLIDPKRAVVRGGSAGGYTTLQALVSKPGIFAAGTSLYGISELTALAEDTHKFELKYMDKLLGGSPSEVPQVYYDRSPVHHAENITDPLLILQGSEDKVVPPSQAELIVDKIKSQGGVVEYKLFSGEGHGWRKSETVKEALELEESWYRERVLQK